MCAVDALGIAPMLGADAVIRSTDPANGRAVTVMFRDGEASWEPVSAVVSVSTGACSGRAVDACCAQLHFFTDAVSASGWAAEQRVSGEVLGQADAEVLGRNIFGPLLGG